MATDSEFRLDFPLASRFGIGHTSRSGNSSDNFPAFMDSCKAILIAFLCFGLLVSFLLLIIVVAKPQVFGAIRTDTCPSLEKQVENKTDKLFCHNSEPTLDCILRSLEKLNHTELSSIRKTIDQQLLNNDSVSRDPSSSVREPIKEHCNRDASLKFYPSKVCLYSRKAKDIHTKCENRTHPRVKFHTTFGSLIVRFKQ